MFRRKTRDKRNGIEFTRRNRITLTNKILISPLLKVLQYMLIISGVYGTIFCLISGLDLKVYTAALLMAIFISVLYFFAVFLMPRFIKYSMSLSLLIFLTAGFVFWKEIQNGFWQVENIYISKFNSYYNTNVLKYLLDDYDEKAVITIFFIFVSILLSQMICGVILRNTFRTLFVIITVPIVFLSFTVGYIPSSVPFGVYLACAISIIGMGTTLKEKHRHFNLKSLHEKQKIDNQLLEQNFKYVIGLKVGGFLAVLLLALILFVSTIFTPKFYAGKVDITDTKQKIQKEMMEFNLEDAVNDISSIQFDGLDLFQGITASGGLSGGKLGRIGEVNFNYQTALRIKTPVMGTSLYLKGYAGSEYKGNYWEGLSKTDLEAYEKTARLWEESDFTIGNQSSYFLSLIKKLGEEAYTDFGFSSGEIDVEGINSNTDYIYAPYYSEFASDALMKVTNPEFVTPKKKQKSYKLDYYSNYNNLLQFDEEADYKKYLNYNTVTTNLLKQLEEYRTYEQAYRKFVYDTYTRVPDAGLERIEKEFGSIKYSEYKEQYGVNALDILIKMVRTNLMSNTSYSLTPGTLPKGKDFVEYFLYENKMGYCSHYASAATVIFRTMGIPARYVEGYIVKPSDISQGENTGTATVSERTNGMLKEYQETMKTINIPDANAHAWVEIYLDGFGWIPVDVTPGFTGNVDFPDTAAGLPDQEGKPVPDKDPPAQSPSENSAEDESVKQPDSKEKTEAPTTDETSGKENKESETGLIASEQDHNRIVWSYIKKIGWILLWSISLIISVILFLLLRVLFIIKKRKNAQKTINFSKRALLRYSEIRRMIDYYRINVNEELTFQEAASQIEKDWKLLQPGRFKRFTDIVLKAKFNQKGISKEESDEAEEFYQELIDSIYKNTTFGRKIILKYIKVFH